MAAFVPPGAPRPGSNSNQQPPPQPQPPIYNPNTLSDNMQNMNLNRARPSGPRPAPFGQPPPFSSASPAPRYNAASPPMSRPGPPPPNVLARSAGPPPFASGRPMGSPASQPPPFASRPPPGTLPSSTTGQVAPSSRGPPLANFPSAPAAVTSRPPPQGVRPNPFASSPMTAGPVAPPMGPTGPVSNGPPLSTLGVMAGAPRFPPPAGQQSLVGPPPSVVSSQVPQAPTMRSLMSGTSPTSLQSTTPFSAPPQTMPPLSAFPFAAPSWPVMRPEQMGGQQRMHGPIRPSGMYGMPPLLNQSLTSIPPAMTSTGAAVGEPSKIDPSQIPRPIPSAAITLHETRQGNQANPPPPATSEYIVRDTGNCSPRFMRCTINQIPCTADLLTTSGMQLALLVQPLALPHPSEEPTQVVDFGESGPVRCSRCKGYINPFMKFVDQGRKFVCNLCGFTDDTPRDYHCNLGPDGRRRDADDRSELCRGTVEFVATKEYMVRDPMPAVYFFLIDVSMNAMQIGATAAACSAIINQVISDLPEGPRTMVGIATFDSTIHFYNLKRALQQPLMLIVPDIQDVYTPLESDVIVPLSECRQHLELLLESIPSMFQSSKTAESAFGAAIKAAFLAMKSTGGKLLVFQSVLPSVGIGALSARDAEGRTNISAGDKEAHKLLQPAEKTLKTMAIEFAEYQVCVDVFLTTQSYIDIASISVVPRITGGQVYYYHPFSALSDPAKLYNDLRWNITRPQGFEAVMRVRCSQGIQVQEYHGNFCKRIPTDIDLPGIDCDKTIMVTLKHDDKLQDGSECAFQCALLYTTVYGQRRIRVTNLSLPVTSMLSAMFRVADLDAIFTCMLKQVANEILTTPLLQVREQETNLCINILHSYRKFCATVSSSGQLILPEALKLLPLYSLALIKSTGLKTDGKIDDRSFWVNSVSSISAPLAIALIYPRMISLHDLNIKEEDGSVIPTVIPLSSAHISDEGIYLVENGEDALIFIGNSVDSGILRQLFGVSTVEEVQPQLQLQQYDNPLSKKLNEVVNEIRRQRCSFLRVRFCKKGDQSGMIFLSQMVEDQNPGGMSYVQFLVHIHRQIQLKMSAN